MKYIVLSFDDGLLDFKNNAFCILKKYGFKASINVVGKFYENNLNHDYYLDSNDIFDFFNQGFEIAVHSDSHLKKETIEDIDSCNRKLKSLLKVQNFGYITPYSIRPSEEVLHYLKNEHYLYCADFSDKPMRLPISFVIMRVINHFQKRNSIQEVINNFRYIYNLKDIKNKSFYCFHRMCVTRDFNVNEVIKVIKRAKNGSCITLMFHSIVKDLDEPHIWKKGAWLVSEFESLLKYLKSNNDIKVITQKELINQ